MPTSRPPKISVITVSYNAADTIAETIISVAAQDYSHVEHIVVDGASNDDSVAIAEKYLRPGGIIRSEPDKGLYDAMNKGLALASGDIVAVLNADDHFAHSSVLSDIAARFEASDKDAVFADIAFFNPDNPDRIVRRYRSDRFRPERIGWGWMPAHPGMFVKRSVYEKVGGYDIGYQIASDFDFVVRAFGRHRCTYEFTNEIAVLMRPGGISTANFAARRMISREMLRACRTHGIRSNWLMLLSRYPAKALEWLR
ncbi:MAG: glycosyltransferase family 2 protein [Sphingopyxis sp.]|jgi:glycosyltransferase involved in cell wall biosynthesis|uniref:glycosyltransferase family 2 protein n=1 Tax=Sphingopyxis sp. TaxID=1908224 RepID=UPI003F71B2B5